MSANFSNWVLWLYVYLGIGAATTLFFLGLTYKERPSKFVKDMRSALGYGKTLKDHLQDGLVSSIASVVVVIGWPGFLVWAFFQKLRERREHMKDEEPTLICKPEHLIRKVSLIEAEQENMITDPLGLTPQLPFGHLNSAWAKFLGEFGFDVSTELWYFEVPIGSDIHDYLTSDGPISGYAKVVKGKVVGEFVIEGG
jgi:hypothetical protein